MFTKLELLICEMQGNLASEQSVVSSPSWQQVLLAELF